MKYFNSTALSIATVVFLFLVLVRMFNVAYPIELKVMNSNQSNELSVSGTGKVDVVPDTAYVDAGITVSRVANADLAKNQISQVNNAIIASLKKLGVDEKDIKTSNFNIYPEYDYSNNPRPLTVPSADDIVTSSGSTGTSSDAVTTMIAPDTQNPNSRIVGYSGNASVSVKVKNKEVVSQVISQVTAAGATNVNGPRFGVDDPEKVREQARNEAIKDAKEQAKKLSKSLGVRLGKITNFSENGANPYYGRDVMMSADAKVEPAVNPEFEEGTETVTSTVTLFYQLK